MDNVDTQTRSRMMSRVGQRNTRPEMLLRSALHRAGQRYRVHVNGLPGTPDLVFPRFGAVVFVHGCYWHSHGCYKSSVPKTNRDFWEEKFRTNRTRDERKCVDLRRRGWRVLVIWECALLGKNALELDDVVTQVKSWLRGAVDEREISGCPRGERAHA
ncbi:MAG: very short patch repair endonuclease [Chloroflexota bacterium]|nr:very short patch repair endonuclease [Chloroflexota bacterium]